MAPIARVGDMHACPMITPGTPPMPHVGGPILAPGCTTVLVGGVPAARATDAALCIGPPDAIAIGSLTVLIGGLMAARIGDPTVHGGVIEAGLPSIEVGEVSMGTPEQHLDVEVRKILSGQKPATSHPRLQAIVDKLYQPQDKFPGGTAGAVRYETATGKLLSRTGHRKKAEDRVRELLKEANSGRLSSHDLLTASFLAEYLKNALLGR